MAETATAAPASARFWDRIAARYAAKPVADEAAYQKKLDITRGYLSPEMDVLELGCGTGSTALAHAPYAARIRATDLSGEMIAIAKRKAAAAGVSNVVFEQAALEELAAPDARYDMALALSLLHLLKDRDAAIARIAQLLKPGGVFISNTACLGDRMAWFKLVAPIGCALGLTPYVSVFTQEALKRSLVGAGFEIEREWRPGAGPSVFIVARKG